MQQLFLFFELKASPVQSVPTSVTLDKYYDVEKKVNANPLFASDPEIQRLMTLSRQQFEEFAKQPTVDLPMGICHGDLTFSNILFNGNNYYLIDFLDSFIESPLLDIVKIRQDSAHLWSQLMYTNHYDKLRLKIVCEKMDIEIDQYFSKYEWYRQYYVIFQIMNFLRILQYAKEEKVITYLKESLSKIIHLNGEPIVKMKNVSIPEGHGFSLIVPAAADYHDSRDVLPNVFSLDKRGIMLCVRAIMGLNLNVFNHIYFSILRKHAELFNVDDMIRLQLRRLGINNAEIVILDSKTSSQAETVYQTIKKKNICGGFFIKDADGYFETAVGNENSIHIFPLEEMTTVDPQHKSYVSVDDMRYVTNIIERRVVSNYFNVGGYGFEKVGDYISCYNHLSTFSQDIYLSHIVYSLLLENIHFKPAKVKNYQDWTVLSRYDI